MTAGSALWLRTGATVAASIALLVALAPEQPSVRLPWPAALAVGACAGLLLYMAGTRRRPRLPRVHGPVSLLVARHGFLGVWAASEEIVWRRALLGELLARGALAALALSSLAFGLAHRARRGLHFGTGAAFGAVYLGTGMLSASIVAHWITMPSSVRPWAGRRQGAGRHLDRRAARRRDQAVRPGRSTRRCDLRRRGGRGCSPSRPERRRQVDRARSTARPPLCRRRSSGALRSRPEVSGVAEHGRRDAAGDSSSRRCASAR